MAICDASLKEMPSVAFASAGASLIPSPTIAVGTALFKEAIFSIF